MFAGYPVVLRGNIGSVSNAGVHINLFFKGTDGRLWERYWDGSRWIWVNTGMPISGNPVILVRGNVYSVDGAAIRINLFVKGTDGRVWERYWDGSQWIWANTGLPATMPATTEIVANQSEITTTEIVANQSEITTTEIVTNQSEITTTEITTEIATNQSTEI